MSIDSFTLSNSRISSTLFVNEEAIEFESRGNENLNSIHFNNSFNGLSSSGKSSTHPKLLTFTPTALKYVSENATSSSNKGRYTTIGLKHNLCFKMVKCNSPLVKTILFSYGFQQCSARNSKFNLLWTTSQLKAHSFRSLAHWQRVNHFPRSFEMTRKDRLYGNIARARQQFGDAFNFIPEFYVAPKELAKFVHVCDQRNDCKKAFIMKPVASSRGNGIFIASTPTDIPLKSEMLISKYISNPYLINGHKFDLRIYVLVTSFHPLTAYIYNEGLSRFASQLYSNSPITFDQPLTHLTNYSLNKLSDKFIRNERAEDEDSGHKWTLGALLRKLKSMGVDIRLLMVRIEDIILKTLLSVQGRITAASRNLLMHSRCCFELFGFDVLIDSKLKPWLLEVNLSPSLTCDSPLDLQLKSALICDVLTLADIPLIDRRNLDTSDNHSEKVLSSKDTALRCSIKLKKYAVCSNRPLNSYSTLKRVCNYEDKARYHYERFIIDSTRRGNFVCIFPRENAWALYSSIMEDVGVEKWDRRLNEDIFGPISLPVDDVIQRTHEQLIDCVKYPNSDALDADVRQLLSTALAQSDAYAQRLTRPGINYATKLPRVRSELRRRTKSLEESEAEQCILNADEPLSDAVSSCDNMNVCDNENMRRGNAICNSGYQFKLPLVTGPFATGSIFDSEEIAAGSIFDSEVIATGSI